MPLDVSHEALISRADAKAQGLKRYFTGIPCAGGHIASRFVANETCAECNRERIVAWRVANHEKVNADSRRWNAENRERAAENKRLWIKENRDRVTAVHRAWYQANREHKSAWAKDWYGRTRASRLAYAAMYMAANKERLRQQRMANPDQVRAANARRRARKLAAGGRYTASDVHILKLRQKNRCAHAWCRVDLLRGGYEIDHIMPLARGGSNWPRNLQLLCMPCNRSKSARHPVDVAREQGLLL